MTIVYADITGQWFSPADGTPLAGAVAKIRANTADGLLRDISTGQVVAGQSRVVTDTDGNLETSLPITGIDPADPQWVIEFEPKLGIAPVYFTLTADTTWAQIISTANAPRQQGLVDRLDQLLAQAGSFVRPASKLTVFGHSYTTSGTTDAAYLFWQRLAAMMGVPSGSVTNYGLTGSQLMTGNPSTNCGYANIIRNSLPLGTRTLADEVVSPQLGPVVGMYGRNDAGDVITNTGAEQATAVLAWRNALRVAWNGLLAGVLVEIEDTSVVTLGGAGSWGSFAATTQNTGTLYKENPTTGATATIAIPAGFIGGVVGVGFVSNRIGGSVKAGPVTFTVDGVAATPIGYSSGFTTLAQNPTASSAGNMVARFSLTPGAHTIVVTSAGGGTGISIDRVVFESPIPRPIIWPNIAHVPVAGATSTLDATTTLMNTALLEVATEFPAASIKIVDIDSLLNRDPALFAADNTHPNDQGHALIAKALADAWTEMTLQTPQLAYV